MKITKYKKFIKNKKKHYLYIYIYIGSGSKKKTSTSGSKKKPRIKEKLAQLKDRKDPTLKDAAQKCKTWAEKNEYVEEQVEKNNIYLVNEYYNKNWQNTKLRSEQTKKNKIKTRQELLDRMDKAWAFGYKAKYAQKINALNEIIKFDNCKWNRIQCIFCGGWYSCHTSQPLSAHLRKVHCHDAAVLTHDKKLLFCKVTKKSLEDLADDEDTINYHSDLFELIKNYNVDPDNKLLKRLKGTKMAKPIHLKSLGKAPSDLLHKSIMECVISLGGTPTIAQKRSLYKLIDVCLC